MVFATVEPGGVLVVALVLGWIAWRFWMMTFRTEDFLKLQQAERERREQQANRLGSAAKIGWGIARVFLRR